MTPSPGWAALSLSAPKPRVRRRRHTAPLHGPGLLTAPRATAEQRRPQAGWAAEQPGKQPGLGSLPRGQLLSPSFAQAKRPPPHTAAGPGHPPTLPVRFCQDSGDQAEALALEVAAPPGPEPPRPLLLTGAPSQAVMMAGGQHPPGQAESCDDITPAGRQLSGNRWHLVLGQDLPQEAP